MLLPKDILDKLYYYHYDYYCTSTDRVKVVYQGWLFKKTKIFEFKRTPGLSEDCKYTTYTMTYECQELINQLHDVMEKNLKEDENKFME